jgi:D-alanine-D-alanine ligase
MRKLTSNPKDFGRVAVLMGGWSTERQVSLWSGEGVLNALQRRGIDATGIDASKETLLSLGQQGYARAFNVLHGTGGEDGTLQAVLDLQGVPYTGSGVLASALAMDKLRTKRMWKAEGLPTPEWMSLRSPGDALKAAEQFGYPLFVKPSDEGSSVGISKVKHATQLGSAFRRAAGEFEHRPRAVLAERFIAGGEYTCAMLDGQPLPLIRIEPEGEFYDYHAKYISDQTRYHCPAGLDPLHEAELARICARAFELIGGRCWGRVDFMLDAQGKPWLLEVNTVPGMTSHSLVPMAARASGIDYEELCWAVLETTLGADRPGEGL